MRSNYRAALAAAFACALFLAFDYSLALADPDSSVVTDRVVVFEEDWNDFRGLRRKVNDYGSLRTNFGVPTTREGADNDWIAARFEYSETGYLKKDIGVSRYAKKHWRGSPTGRVEDDAGLVVPIDLTGFKDVQLSFDWETICADRNDRFVVAFYVGDDLGGPGRAFDWFNNRNFGAGDLSARDRQGQANPWYQENWTEVLRDTSSHRISRERGIELSGADNQEIYLAFWLDGDEGDLGRFDNIVITATAIPEPSGIIMLAAAGGLLWYIRRGR